MPGLRTALNPLSWLRLVRDGLREGRLRRRPNLRGVELYPPGHFYSPLLDIQGLEPGLSSVPFDGAECWEHVELHPSLQRAYYEDLLERFPMLPFPKERGKDYRYFTENPWFVPSDAFTLSGIIRKERPRRIVEVGSGFSSAVMLDTLNATRAAAALTFIEPNPGRLETLLAPADRSAATIWAKRVQEVPLAVFEELEAQDLLFIDSSHVAKIGSDLTFLLLRVLPRLKAGVLVHFHDIFFPHSYPLGWIREGRAWNESLFLRAFLVGNANFQVLAFNSFAGHSFPELFRDRLACFLEDPGGSIWLKKVA